MATASTAFILADLCAKYLRSADAITLDGSQNIVASFTPALSVAEQATFADLQTMASFGLPATITLAEFRAIKANLTELKPGSPLDTSIVALRTRTDAQWNALTAAQRQADQITWLRNLTDAVADLRAVIGALLRS